MRLSEQSFPVISPLDAVIWMSTEGAVVWEARGPWCSWDLLGLAPALASLLVGRSLHPACHRQCESLALLESPVGSKPGSRLSIHVLLSLVQVSRSCFMLVSTNVCPFLQRQSNLGRGANRPEPDEQRHLCPNLASLYYLGLRSGGVPGRLC